MQLPEDPSSQYLECICSVNDVECQNVCVMYAKEADTSCRHIKQAKTDCDVYDRLMDNYCREDRTCNIGEKAQETGGKTVCEPP